MAEQRKRSFKALQSLGTATVEEVNRRLLAGDSPSSVAKWLQEDLQVLKDLQPGSVKKNLERYRAADLKDMVVSQVVDTVKGKSVAGIKKKLIAMEELEEMVCIQRSRFDMVYFKEQKMPEGILLKQASDEARLLKEMLVELGKLQLETGVMARAPKKITGQVVGADGEVKEFSWTEEQERLYRELDNIDYSQVEDLPSEQV